MSETLGVRAAAMTPAGIEMLRHTKGVRHEREGLAQGRQLVLVGDPGAGVWSSVPTATCVTLS